MFCKQQGKEPSFGNSLLPLLYIKVQAGLFENKNCTFALAYPKPALPGDPLPEKYTPNYNLWMF
jgi:hypothetical protein